jgi:hypothetical protein
MDARPATPLDHAPAAAPVRARRRRRGPAAVLGALALVLACADVVPAAADHGDPVRRITFPVEGGARYGDDFGNARSGGRSHAGNDLMANKMTPVRAAFDGKVTWFRHDSTGLSGNALGITDAEGYTANYMHINNDTPGSDDGRNERHLAFAPGIDKGVRVQAGQVVAYVGDSGNAEGTAPHLHFELEAPNGTAFNPYTSLRLAQGLTAGNHCGYDTNPAPRTDAGAPKGFWVAAADGGVFAKGSAPFHGSAGALPLQRPVVGMAATPGNGGYYLVASDGGIFSYGNATFRGSTGGMRLNQPIVGMAVTPSAGGYWLVASDGGVFAFGDATFHGSTGAMRLNKPIVGMAPTPSGRGYHLVASDGGIFAFGDAAFHGSTGAMALARPIVGMTPTATGGGYLLAAADGGVFTFGDARFAGGVPASGLCRIPNVKGIASAGAGGYWMVADSGAVFGFGTAAHLGNAATTRAVAVASTR